MSAARRVRDETLEPVPGWFGRAIAIVSAKIDTLGDRLLTEERRPIPPCDLDAERNLVSSALWGYVHPELEPEHFFAHTWGEIYSIAMVYAEHRIRPTYEQLIEAVRAAGAVPEAFIPSLRALLDAPVLTRPAATAERVIRLAAKRRALELLLRAEEQIRAVEGDVDRGIELLVEAADAAQGGR